MCGEGIVVFVAPKPGSGVLVLGANGIITEPELMKATGYEARGRLVSHLERNGVPFFVGNGGQIWTTLEAINRAVMPESSGDEEIEF